MTEKDKGLISMAKSAGRCNYNFIASLIPEAETEEAKKQLVKLEQLAFKSAEIAAFDL